jgi:hypothetical protein
VRFRIVVAGSLAGGRSGRVEHTGTDAALSEVLCDGCNCANRGTLKIGAGIEPYKESDAGRGRGRAAV